MSEVLPREMPQPNQWQVDQLQPLSRSEATAHLKDVFRPLAHDVADAVLAAPAELTESAKNIPTYLLGNTDAALALPWDIFLHTDEAAMVVAPRQAQPDTARTLDNTPSFIISAIDDYMLRHAPPANTSRAARVKHNQALTQLEDAVYDYFVKEPGESIAAYPFVLRQKLNPQLWKQNEQVIKSMSEPERAAYEAFADIRLWNIEKWQGHTPSMQRVDQAIYAHAPAASPAALLSNIVLPVSEYGADFTAELARVTLAMSQKARAVLLPKAGEVTTANQRLLQTFTARGQEGATEESTLAVIAEGILSIGQTLALLTAQKVAGYDDPKVLVRDIATSGLVEKIARDSPLGLVGPMALSGFIFPAALKRPDLGLELGDEFEAHLRQARAKYISQYVLKQATQPADMGGYRPIGTTCPVAGKAGGLHALAEAFWAVLSGTQGTLQLPRSM